MAEMVNNCTAVILAGGENKRMPVIKSFIKIEGDTIINRQLMVLKALFYNIMIITNEPQRYIHLKIPLYGDVYPRRGPLTGILTALINSKTEWVCITACDMPFLNEQLLRYMASQTEGYECVVPCNGSQVEPLMAFYCRNSADAMEKALKAGERKIQRFLACQKVKYIKKSTIKHLCPHNRTFINLNTPENIYYIQKKYKLDIDKSVRVKLRGSSL
jgi:molybdopterin-guanine dinucleotide biosynthesis protein A